MSIAVFLYRLDQITEAYKASWESFWDEEPEGYI